MDSAKIMQMIEGIKGSLAELESELGGEEQTEMTPELEGEEGAAPVEGEGEMPPSLSKFMRG